MADDAGALLVRSGLVTASALDDARAFAAESGGTIGEALVHAGVIADDALTEFYATRLLVPKVNPNGLARLSARVIAIVPADMAVELRSIPVSLDGDNNLTVAMSDPSDRHAVDEIGFFTGAYVVRAVATQMQIAWCLAHYYGHVTVLGQRLLQPSQVAAVAAAAAAKAAESPAASARLPRAKGLTAKVNAARHAALPPDVTAADLATIQRPRSTVLDDPSPAPPAPAPVADDGVPQAPRPRTASGEIRIRAASIKPPLPEEESGPTIITIEASGPTVITMDADSGPVTIPAEPPPPPPPVRRQRVVREDPPELAARTGELTMRAPTRPDLDAEDSIVIDTAALLPPSPPSPPELAPRSGELGSKPAIEIVDEPSAPVVIHAPVPAPVPDEPSAPILLERKRPSGPPADVPTQPLRPRVAPAPAPAPAPAAAPNDASFADDLADTAHDEIMLLIPKAGTRSERRVEKRTQMGMIPHAATTRARTQDDEVTGVRDPEPADAAVPGEIDDGPTTSQVMFASAPDPTGVDRLPAPPAVERDDADDTRETQAIPEPTTDDDSDAIVDTGQHILPPPLAGRATLQMSAAELDAAVPGRAGVVARAAAIDYDPLDDGWGPPGTTIPPPLLGAVPGSEPREANAAIPVPDVDSAPLLVAPPHAPESRQSQSAIPLPTGAAPGSGPLETSGQTLVRALEEATSRAIELIRNLEAAPDRDHVIDLLVAHLATTHRRAGFFAVKGGELSLFAVSPRPASLPFAALRLDRPSTLQDVVGTRLPYRGPMHDEQSRAFLAAALGDAPPEILLVPITIKERVVGVLFGEHRLRHTFDDQLALAARAAGMSLERILRQHRR